MPRVQFTRHLLAHFPTLTEVEVGGGTVGQVVAGWTAATRGERAI